MQSTLPLLFHTKRFGFEMKVFPTHLDIKQSAGLGSRLQSIPVSHITGVEIKGLSRKLFIHTNDRKTHIFVIGRHVDQAKDAILQAIAQLAAPSFAIPAAPAPRSVPFPHQPAISQPKHGAYCQACGQYSPAAPAFCMNCGMQLEKAPAPEAVRRTPAPTSAPGFAQFSHQQAPASPQRKKILWSIVGVMFLCGGISSIINPQGRAPSSERASQSHASQSATPLSAAERPSTPATPEPTQTPAPTATPVPTEMPRIATVRQGGNLRKMPLIEDGNVVGQVSEGGTLRVEGKTSDEEWLSVTTGDGLSGWIHKSLVSVEAQVVSLVPVPTFPPTPTVRTVGFDEEAEAVVFCRDVMEKSLKAPASAKFPWLPDETRYIGTDTVAILDHVDAQNAFGAMIRTSYICHVRFDWSQGKKVIDVFEVEP